MKQQKRSNIQYDTESKILSIRLSKEKSVDSDVYDNVVVDYGKKGNLVNVDIMDISMNDFKRIPMMQKEVMITKDRSAKKRIAEKV